MIIGDLSARLAAARGRLIIDLSRAVTRWGGQVPEDPGVAELADLLDGAAATLHGTTRSGARTELAVAVYHLRAADRLGGLLPAVTLWHLRQAHQRSADLPAPTGPITLPGVPASQPALPGLGGPVRTCAGQPALKAAPAPADLNSSRPVA
ncbi:hypothetical protein [Streptomyces anulatus]|uniref:hypothetical protein n=1 Tax=Streptomyces anulatus TaxID=1892 RepID=UPI003688061D